MGERRGGAACLHYFSRLFTFALRKTKLDVTEIMDAGELAWRREMEEMTKSVAQLIAQYELLRREMRSRTEENASLRARVANLEAELAEARESNLTASAGRAFGPGSEDSRKARERLNGMIREVDACIALLRS